MKVVINIHCASGRAERGTVGGGVSKVEGSVQDLTAVKWSNLDWVSRFFVFANAPPSALTNETRDCLVHWSRVIPLL